MDFACSFPWRIILVLQLAVSNEGNCYKKRAQARRRKKRRRRAPCVPLSSMAGCFEWSLSMPASFIGKVRSPKRAFHFPRGATLRWQPSQPERANIFTSWKGKRQVPQQEQLQRSVLTRLSKAACLDSLLLHSTHHGVVVLAPRRHPPPLTYCSECLHGGKRWLPVLHFIWLATYSRRMLPPVNAWRHQMIER